jgi:hypothetical protein
MANEELAGQYTSAKVAAQADGQLVPTAISRGIATDEWQDAIIVLTRLSKVVLEAQSLQEQLKT